MRTLEGHEGAVLCLAALPGDGARLLSGSGDKTIRLWAEGRCAGVFTGHTDTVRWAKTMSHPFHFTCLYLAINVQSFATVLMQAIDSGL